MNKKKAVKELFVILFGMFLVAGAVYFFMIPSNIVVGSVAGLAMVLSQLFRIPISTLTFLLNVVLLVIGFIFIGREFGAKTVFTAMLLPLYLGIFEKLIPISESLTGNIVVDLVAYILIVSIGQALLFQVNASSGGLDIVAKIINKFTHMEIGKAVSLAGIVTAVSSILVYDVSVLIISILGTYANGIVLDYYVDGFKKKKRICILSDDYEEIQHYIMEELKRGATLYTAKGAYEQKERVELVTILTLQEYKQLLVYLNKYHAEKPLFVTVSMVNEVIGGWNTK